MKGAGKMKGKKNNLLVEIEILEGLKVQRRGGLVGTLTLCFMGCKTYPCLLSH